MLKKIYSFFTDTLWTLPLAKQTTRLRFGLRLLRTLVLTVRGSREDIIGLRASALTVYTLLAVVPMAALAFGIAKGFGLKQYLEQQLYENFKGQQEVLDWIIQFADSFLDDTKGGIIAGIGLAILFWSVLKVVSNIESSFNTIWQIKRSRSLFRKFSDYLSLMLIAPILFIISSSATVFITTHIEEITSEIELFGLIAPAISFLVRLTPYFVMWLMFTFLYMFMPNTKVNFKSALIGGIVAGTAFVLLQWLYINLQIGVSRYNAIYGSFAVLPLFIVWLQISWLIVMFGAELAFSDQNVKQYEFESQVDNISLYSKKTIALIITHLLVKQFTKAEGPLTAEEISSQLKIPIRLVDKILYELVECNILSETVSPNTEERAYQPAQDADNLSIAYVIDQMEHLGKDKIMALEDQSHERIKEIVSNSRMNTYKGDAATLLKNI